MYNSFLLNFFISCFQMVKKSEMGLIFLYCSVHFLKEATISSRDAMMSFPVTQELRGAGSQCTSPLQLPGCLRGGRPTQGGEQQPGPGLEHHLGVGIASS